VSPVSALAKQEPVKTSQVRASTYCPRSVADESKDSRMGTSSRQDMRSPPGGVEYLVSLLGERPLTSSERMTNRPQVPEGLVSFGRGCRMSPRNRRPGCSISRKDPISGAGLYTRNARITPRLAALSK